MNHTAEPHRAWYALESAERALLNAEDQDLHPDATPAQRNERTARLARLTGDVERLRRVITEQDA